MSPQKAKAALSGCSGTSTPAVESSPATPHSEPEWVGKLAVARRLANARNRPSGVEGYACRSERDWGPLSGVACVEAWPHSVSRDEPHSVSRDEPRSVSRDEPRSGSCDEPRCGSCDEPRCGSCDEPRCGFRHDQSGRILQVPSAEAQARCPDQPLGVEFGAAAQGAVGAAGGAGAEARPGVPEPDPIQNDAIQHHTDSLASSVSDSSVSRCTSHLRSVAAQV